MAIQTTIEVLRIPGTLFPRGAFDENASYKFLNIVESGGNGYVCLQPCTGIPVTNTAYWFKFVFKGDKGDAFTYADLTAEQKAELVRDATAAAQAAATSAQSAADDAAAALQKFNTIKAAIDAIDPTSTEGSIQTLAAKQGVLEAELNALGPKISELDGQINGYYDKITHTSSGSNVTILLSEIGKVVGDRVDFEYDGNISDLHIYTKTAQSLIALMTLTDDGNGKGHFTIPATPSTVNGIRVVVETASFPSGKTITFISSFIKGVSQNINSLTNSVAQTSTDLTKLNWQINNVSFNLNIVAGQEYNFTDKFRINIPYGVRLYFRFLSEGNSMSCFLRGYTADGETRVNVKEKDYGGGSYFSPNSSRYYWVEFSADVEYISLYASSASSASVLSTLIVSREDSVAYSIPVLKQKTERIEELGLLKYFGGKITFNTLGGLFTLQPTNMYKEVLAVKNIKAIRLNALSTYFIIENNELIRITHPRMTMKVIYTDNTSSTNFNVGLQKNVVYAVDKLLFVWDDSFLDWIETKDEWMFDNYNDVRSYVETNYPTSIHTNDSGWSTDILFVPSNTKDLTALAYDEYPLVKPLIFADKQKLSVINRVTPPSVVFGDYTLQHEQQEFSSVNSSDIVDSSGVLNVLSEDSFIEIDSAIERLNIDGNGHKICFYDIKIESNNIANSRRVFNFGYDCSSCETFVDQNFNVLHLSKTPFLPCPSRVCKMENNILVPINDNLDAPYQGNAYYPLPKSFNTNGLDLTNAYLSYSTFFHRYTSKVIDKYVEDGVTYIIVNTTGVVYPLNSEYSGHGRFPSIQIVNCYPYAPNCIYHNANNTLTAPLTVTSLFTRRTLSYSGINVYLYNCECYAPSVSSERGQFEYVAPAPLFNPSRQNVVTIGNVRAKLTDLFIRGVGDIFVTNSSFCDSEGTVIDQIENWSIEDITSRCTIQDCVFYDNNHFASNMNVVKMRQKYHINRCTFRDFYYCAIGLGYLVYYTTAYSKSYGCVEHCRFCYTPEFLQRVSKIAVPEDGGVIYNSTINELSIIRYNVIHSVYGKGANAGIYFDDGCSNCYAFNNLVYSVGAASITMRYATSDRILPDGYSQNVNKYCGCNIVDSNIVIGASDGTYSVCEGNVLVNGAIITVTSGYDFSIVENNITANGFLGEEQLNVNCDISNISYPESPFPTKMAKEE